MVKHVPRKTQLRAVLQGDSSGTLVIHIKDGQAVQLLNSDKTLVPSANMI